MIRPFVTTVPYYRYMALANTRPVLLCIGTSYKSCRIFDFVRACKSTDIANRISKEKSIHSDPKQPISPSSVVSKEEVVTSVENDDALQPQWKGLESRMLRKRTKVKGYGGPEGRSARNSSAWDAENV